MAEKDSGDGPSLELPSFGLRRRRRDDSSDEPTTPESSAPAPAAEQPTRAMPVAVDEEEPTPAPEPAPAPKRRRRERTTRRPSLSPLPAAAVTGAVVGLLLVGLMWAALQSCDFIRGTSSCQGGGVVMWLAILVVAVIGGRFLLSWFGLGEAGSTSFLAVGLTAVVILLFLSRQLESPWMALVLPATSAASYALSHWVTTAFVEQSGPEHHR